ncbi:MAG: hypothetical protein RIR48_1628 [Bacteroidota bacterium]|jgi:uncharacterized protein (DUF58 family)
MQNILSKLIKYEIKIRKAVNSQMRGSFHSIFKGSGLEFSDLRTYQYGDDIRSIDWNTTAKGHGTYVKIFKEEKEQNVFFMLDISASQEIGNSNRQKIDTSKEICGVLALSAIREASHVGLYCFTDQKELYLRPSHGMKHGYEFILKLFKLQPVSTKTDINTALHFAMNILRRKSVIILISDFLDDQNYLNNLKALSRKHDLVIIHLFDKREVELPSLGIIPVVDKESGSTIWLNTSSVSTKKDIKQLIIDRQKTLELFCKQHNAAYLSIDAQEDYVPRLVQLFRIRN